MCTYTSNTNIKRYYVKEIKPEEIVLFYLYFNDTSYFVLF